MRLFAVPDWGLRAWVAQLVEQRIENPRVGGSNPPPGTISYLGSNRFAVLIACSAIRRLAAQFKCMAVTHDACLKDRCPIIHVTIG